MRARALAVAVALLVVVGMAVAQSAGAAAIGDAEELTEVGEFGTGAGQLNSPVGLASDPLSGHLYAVESENHRVSEFNPWGGFVKAFGFDVAPGAVAVNEQQEVRVRAAGGEFKLSLEGEASAGLAFDASGGEVEAALNGLAKVGADGVSVEEVAGNPDGSTPYVYLVSFSGSAFAGTDVAQLEAETESGPSELSGGVPSTSLEVRTRADGHAATSGFETCTEESGCKAGLQGSGAGQMSAAEGVAVDSAGNVYVSEVGNHRVQKFDSAGRFVSMFGGEVDKTTHANVCTAADLKGGDECGIGVAGAGPGQLGGEGGLGIALCPAGAPPCPAGALFVADRERIERFSLEGEFEGELPLPGELVEGVAFDPVSEDLYATFREHKLHKLDPNSGKEIGTALEGSGALAVDGEGDVFAPFEGKKVLEYGPSGSQLAPPSCCAASPPLLILGLGTNGAGDLDVANYASGLDSSIGVFGPAPLAFEGPPKVPPQILAEFATSVRPDGASVAAEINPHFFPDAHYFVQYGTGKCSEGGCEEEAPTPPALLTAKATNLAVRSAAVALEGLSPGTTYHYRFVAQSGGGPVIGEEAAFRTPEPLPPRSQCSNEAFRGGAGARLPDCRAYEMVSPLDKNNGDLKTLLDDSGYTTDLEQSAAGGESFTYSSSRSFGDPEGAPYTNQYLASRDPQAGWSSRAIDPPQGAAAAKEGVLENPYKAFSADLCRGWFVVAAEPLLDPGRDFANYPNLYRRDNCGEEGDEALVPMAVKPSFEAKLFSAEPQGLSADGKAAILRANERLSEDAASGKWQAYYVSEGSAPRLLCILPNGTPSGGNCSGGSGGREVGGSALNRLANVAEALSADGSKAYWTDSGANATGAGKVYLRINPGAEQSAEECEAQKACTVAVSDTVTSEASRFLQASPEGERALFEVVKGAKEGKLYEFELGGGSTLIAGKVLGLAGASEDLSRIYLVSEEALTGAEENAQGEVAEAGEPNLYLDEVDEEGAKTFIARLSGTDVADPSAGNKVPSDSAPEPVFHAARATPDGRALAFISTRSLSGDDNTDLGNGAADSQVYLYEAGAGGPVCVSCNPGGARPQGRLVQGTANSAKNLATAGSLPMPTVELQVPRALSADGKRLFFNSFDALVPRDTNGTEDVYDWESAASKEACEEAGAELYVEAAAGCLSLISSGESPQDSGFADASTDGRDAFFITNASLLPQDPGLFDAYDARAGGGLPPPPPPPPDCQGETCKPAAGTPESVTPASSAYEGPGNLKEKLKKKRHHHKKHKKRHHKRRAGR